LQGFIIFDSIGDRFPEFSRQMTKWVKQGRIEYREDVVDRLVQAPQAFIGLLRGENFGKRVVRVGNAD